MRRLVLLGLVIASPAFAFPKLKPPPPARVPEVTPPHAPAMAFVALDDRMAMTKLPPAVYVPNLCVLRYRVGTSSADCQKFVDQSLGYFYSYVWIEAARSAETAVRHDPNCAYAWLLLHKGLEKWGRSTEATTALKKAQELMPKAPHREQMLITARLHEKGLLGAANVDERKKKAAATLDEMLTIYDDDTEAWFARGALNGTQMVQNESVPYYKALLRIDPVHPGANHELVHFHELARRPALGWPNAQGYMASSPGLPHAFHMQSHLAMRIGKWEKTTDWSTKAIELQREYHKVQGVKHHQDHQFSHHLETLTLALVHDGRYREADSIRVECGQYGYRFNIPWFRMAVGMQDWEAADRVIVEQRKRDKTLAAYLGAMMYLERGDTAKASAEVDVLRQATQTKKGDRRLEQRLWEAQGRLMCQTGSGVEGCKLIQRVVDKTKDEYHYHAWGGGAAAMESWGIGALEAGLADQAEEAFLEALAHDAGSATAAFGMRALCERLGRKDEAKVFDALGRRLWAKADSMAVEALRDSMTKRAEKLPPATAATSTPPMPTNPARN